MYTQQQLAKAYEKAASPLLTEFGNYARGFHAGHYLQNFVHTAEEADNLPEGTVIVTEQGGVYCAADRVDESWNNLVTRVWEETGTEIEQLSNDLTLPARIIGNASDEWKI